MCGLVWQQPLRLLLRPCQAFSATLPLHCLSGIGMSQTPRSRTSSRASTPGLSLTRSPSRLVMPPLRSPASTSNLHIHSHSTGSLTPVAIPPLQAQPIIQVLESSASSLINVDLNEGIMLQDADTDVDTAEGEDVTVMGHVETSAGDDDSKKMLRDQLRKTLSHRQSRSGQLGSGSHRDAEGRVTIV